LISELTESMQVDLRFLSVVTFSKYAEIDKKRTTRTQSKEKVIITKGYGYLSYFSIMSQMNILIQTQGLKHGVIENLSKIVRPCVTNFFLLRPYRNDYGN